MDDPGLAERLFPEADAAPAGSPLDPPPGLTSVPVEGEPEFDITLAGIGAGGEFRQSVQQARSSTTVWEVKRLAYEAFDMAPDQMRLLRESTGEELEGDRALSHYPGIEEGKLVVARAPEQGRDAMDMPRRAVRDWSPALMVTAILTRIHDELLSAAREMLAGRFPNHGCDARRVLHAEGHPAFMAKAREWTACYAAQEPAPARVEWVQAMWQEASGNLAPLSAAWAKEPFAVNIWARQES